MPRMAALFSSVLTVLLLPHFAQAQEIRWRKDYAAARKEAATTGKPMLLDFGTEGCIWCRKQDASTFRDRGVVELINDRFIPVKIDADHDPRLTQSAGVQAFPSIVLAMADGKIVERHEGFADTTKMMAMLRHVPARQEPKSVAAPRSAATNLLVAARADHDAGRYLLCLQKCDQLVTNYAATTEVGEARRLSTAIAADPVKWKRVAIELEGDFTAAKRELEAALKR